MATEQVSVESVVDDGWTNAGREWRDPANWHWGFYSAPNDPRIWVRKRTIAFRMDVQLRASRELVLDRRDAGRGFRSDGGQRVDERLILKR
jgi:hypothetical protein